MMYGKKRYSHWHENMNDVPGGGRHGAGRGMEGFGRGPMWGQRRRMRRRDCWEQEDADTQRAWLEARKQRLQSRLAEVEEALLALDQDNPVD